MSVVKRQLPSVVACVAASVLAGCSSGESGSSTSAATETGTTTITESREIVRSGTLEKKVGETAGYSCEQSGKCALDFKVTKMLRVDRSSCRSLVMSIPKDALLVRVAIDVKVNSVDANNLPAGSAVSSSNWYGYGTDEYTTKAEVAAGCDYKAGAFHDTPAIGEKQRGEIVFALPANTTHLQLKPQQALNGPSWRWEIPK